MLTLALVLASALAQQQASDPKSHVLIIAGIAGEPQYDQEFYDEGKRIIEAAHTKYGIPENRITFLAEHPERDSVHIRGPSTKVEIEKAFAAITSSAKPGDIVFVMLIGHGSSQDDKSSKFTIPGPDMAAEDFAKLLVPLSKQQVVFVNSTSASGDFIAKLAGENRIIITATLSPLQRNYTRFAKHFTAAYAGTDADANKDGRVSLLEAFDYTRRKVKQEYKADSLLQSEQAMLDDNGDGKGTDLPDLLAPDGRLASRVFLTGVAPEDPQVTALLSQHEALRLKLDSLDRQTAGADSTAYGQQLQGAVVDMVILNLKILQVGARAGGKP